ncbi:hypothetical protein BHE74_00036728 [Ensete ventricosum]|nr:hypothetical protein GW17_00025382 [Ensete ventricosum]RWW56548.1 hypothetical protein BHE74_00036728 [Ensete ventricosum]
MAPQDQAPVKDADLEHMPMNLKEGDSYVVNYGEGLTVVDFGGHVRPTVKGGAAAWGAVLAVERLKQRRKGRWQQRQGTVC